MEGTELFLLLMERHPFVAVWSYLLQYVYRWRVDHGYGNTADSSFGLLAPL
jgi:hypothetical protein